MMILQARISSSPISAPSRPSEGSATTFTMAKVGDTTYTKSTSHNNFDFEGLNRTRASYMPQVQGSNPGSPPVPSNSTSGGLPSDSSSGSLPSDSSSGGKPSDSGSGSKSNLLIKLLLTLMSSKDKGSQPKNTALQIIIQMINSCINADPSSKADGSTTDPSSDTTDPSSDATNPSSDATDPSSTSTEPVGTLAGDNTEIPQAQPDLTNQQDQQVAA